LKKMLFVLNPYAGTRKASKMLSEILAVFNRAMFDVRVYVTAEAGDAIGAVAEMAPDMDLVVCSGGDGTFNETVTGLMKAGLDLPIGYIPAGSTNDFATSLGLSSDCLEAARQIAAGIPCRYDTGKFGDRYFSYVASFGAFTRASYSTPQSAKNLLGHAAYLLEGMQEISQIRKHHVKMTLDDGEVLEDDYVFGAICNSTSVAGIMTLDPRQVDLRDGKFEVLLIRAPKNLQEISECLLSVQKQQYNNAMMTFRSASSVLVEAEPDMPWTLDGEKEEGHAAVQVRNLHHAIRIIRKEDETDA
jgi:YegS/Rv2252/BmrU family lipid kinase